MQFLSLTVPGAVVLALSGLLGVWVMRAPVAKAPTFARAPAAAAPKIAANPYGGLTDPGFSSGPIPGLLAASTVAERPAVAAAPASAANPYGGLVDPGFSSGATPVLPTRSLTLEASLETLPPRRPVTIAAVEGVAPARPTPHLGEGPPLPPERPAAIAALDSVTPPTTVPADSAPLPPHRPAEFAMPPDQPAPRVARENARAALPAAPPDNRTFFERLFGARQHLEPALAHAVPENKIVASAPSTASGPSLRYDQWTAVYDLAAHTVYLPNGTRLEAHSGLGDRLDDPRHVDERMRGATPPNLYELALREQSFHGVQALRLKPVGDANIFGRAGLLAHSYMLGPNGDSNGCVSFKDYEAFLQAFNNGQVKRLAVVARLD